MLALAIAATCAALPAVVRDAPAGETVVLTTDCPADRELLIARRAEPLTIDATGRFLPGGLRLFRVSGLVWRGGTIEALGGAQAAGRAGYGVTLEESSAVTLDGVEVRNARTGVVTIRPGPGLHRIANSRLHRLGSDGINFPGVVAGEIVGNDIRGFEAVRSTCWKGGVQVGSSPIGRAACEAMGGTWRDGAHPDAVQIWGNARDILIEANHISAPAPQAAQGITTFGSAEDRYARIRVIGNRIETDDANAIAIGNCTGCEVRGNVLAGPTRPDEPYIRLFGETAGLVACGNRTTSRHPLKQAGTEACPPEPTADGVVVRVIAPAGVKVVVESPE
ncbi:right-handed parallel beta-helix repeat-containing protein [Thermaurantiacus tibetensis]|uniref:right-handed parallel beta-helix repeat-containing protein n=1 Tax=Thermaurantiacus tibetensis TaxID=2759035 RepID=UPI00188FD2D3|nr:right-handed parallel beta-helix repeat-containing protein [Thermaurantiacus tibetensis]